MATKSKSKTVSKTASKTAKKSKAAVLPSGYKVIGRAPNWNPEKDSVVEGVRGESRDVEFKQPLKRGQKKPEVRTVRTVVVQDETLGAVTVWESGMLRDFFDQTEEGDQIRIEYLGLGKAKPGQNAPKLYSCGRME